MHISSWIFIIAVHKHPCTLQIAHWSYLVSSPTAFSSYVFVFETATCCNLGMQKYQIHQKARDGNLCSMITRFVEGLDSNLHVHDDGLNKMTGIFR